MKNSVKEFRTAVLGEIIITQNHQTLGKVYAKHYNFSCVSESDSWLLNLDICVGLNHEEIQELKNQVWYDLLVLDGGAVSIPASEIKFVLSSEGLELNNPRESFYF